MKRIVSILCITILLVLIFIDEEQSNKNTSYTYYTSLVENEPIGSTLTIKDAIIWLQNQVDFYEIILTTKGKYVSIKYRFRTVKEPFASIELIYEKDKCRHLILRTGVNGSTGIYYDNTAKKMLMMFISYNEDFDYYF